MDKARAAKGRWALPNPAAGMNACFYRVAVSAGKRWTRTSRSSENGHVLIQGLNMADNSRLLRVAVDDNIAWCSRVCSAHGSNEMRSAGAWANLAVSPSFYPNIITSGYGVRDEIEKLVPKVRLSNQARRWGIKDSFADLDLAEQGFEPIVTGSWYGAVVSSGPSSVGWKAVASPAELEIASREVV